MSGAGTHHGVGVGAWGRGHYRPLASTPAVPPPSTLLAALAPYNQDALRIVHAQNDILFSLGDIGLAPALAPSGTTRRTTGPAQRPTCALQPTCPPPRAHPHTRWPLHQRPCPGITSTLLPHHKPRSQCNLTQQVPHSLVPFAPANAFLTPNPKPTLPSRSPSFAPRPRRTTRCRLAAAAAATSRSTPPPSPSRPSTG